MLVLSREIGEQIELEIREGFSGKITIAYLGDLIRNVGENKIREARIGIKAPMDVTILRSELGKHVSK